jgi:DNA-binding transcriptional regulator YiaG
MLREAYMNLNLVTTGPAATRHELAGRIKATRKALALTQAELADSLDVTVRSVQNWEAAETEPRGRAMRRLAELAEAPVSWFTVAEAA